MPAAIKFSAEQTESMVLAYLGGKSFKQISDGSGVAKNTVRGCLLAVGVTPNLSRSMSAVHLGRPSHRKGAIMSPVSRQKMRDSHALRGPRAKTGPHSAERRANISAALRARTEPSNRSGYRHPRKYSPEESVRRERVRQVCKRFVARVLKAKGSPKTATTQQIVGYTSDQLRAHLGAFPSGWHVDHYVPIVEFFRRGIFDPAVINALVNLRAIPALDNRRKNAKVPADADAIIAACFASVDPQMRGQILTKASGGGYVEGLPA